MSLGHINKKITLNLIYTPQAISAGTNTTNAPLIYSIGDGKNQISLDLLSKIIQYAKYGENSSSGSFQDLLGAAMFKGLNEEEKSILKAVETDRIGFSNSQLVIHEEDTNIDYPILMGLPTEEYLKDLKIMEETLIKNNELHKFYKKMAKISGTLPLEEMVQDVAGTNIRLSNLHITDMDRLNDLKIHSTVFA